VTAVIPSSLPFCQPHTDRTTRRYDRARDTLDRNAAYTLTAYLASG
jgi:hypothetical protein